ncbi:MAG: hypothetical protein GC155_16325 [Alphaproteobacteria bacterium]|nr:hypothetical protein [Alphaproteobacteria bacterium]
MPEGPYSLRLTEENWRSIYALIDQGTYGDNRAEVIKRFIQEGIRRAQHSNDIPGKTGSPDVVPPPE